MSDKTHQNEKNLLPEFYLVYVLVPVSLLKEVVAETTSVLMASYDKGLEVDEHEAQCPCLFAKIRDQAEKLAESRIKITDAPTECSESERNLALFKSVANYALDYQEVKTTAVRELVDKAAPDRNCNKCGGSGIIRTTANPNGKWTHWEKGGFASGKILKSVKGGVADLDRIPVSMLDIEKVPLDNVWAIITPDGEWHAAGDPFWFGAQRIDDRDWENTARNILRKHSDTILVVVQCQP